VFENVLGQPATDQLIQDLNAGALASAMLFSGPLASGKGTAALELGRIVSCEKGGAGKRNGEANVKSEKTVWADWNCDCPSCSRFRLLVHPDLLCLGWKPFSAEIAASAGAFAREITASPEVKSHSGVILFIRSVRKLTARFNPVLLEDDPKAGKISTLSNSLGEDLDEFELQPSVKLAESILKNAFKLESEGIGEIIPIAQLRRAASWASLAPTGRRKLLLIENAERMQEEGRNSLLKLLEEPPGRLCIVLTTSRTSSMLPTVLSRLRPYRFNARSAAVEDEVIRRVFHDQAVPQLSSSNRIGDYLDSFLPVSKETLEAAAACFAASVAYKAFQLSKKSGRPLPEEAILLGKYCAPKAESAGFGRPKDDMAQVLALLLEKTGRFEIPSLFSRFLASLLDLVSESLAEPVSEKSPAPSSFLPQVAYNELWKKSTGWAETAVKVYKLKPAQVMERLFTELGRGMAAL